ncbi:hypothetical protein [Roseomonas sp. BN140053]|uniref:hypothetical protein n=1 Tax=Roseomonas sp. BN140053 TaxID=3391898 RepID=UPI0039EBCD22
MSEAEQFALARRQIALRLAKWAAGLLVPGVLILFWFWVETGLVHAPPPSGDIQSAGGNGTWALVAAIGSTLTGLLAAVASISNLTLAWRAERRQTREAMLKLRQLELQVKELEAKQVQAPPPP